MIDALKAVDLPSKLTAQERSALLACDLPAPEIAACMKAIDDGALGDQWDRDHLTVNQGIKLHRGWKARQGKPAPTKKTTPTGLPDTVETGFRWMQMSKAREERDRADDAGGVLPALRAPDPRL